MSTTPPPQVNVRAIGGELTPAMQAAGESWAEKNAPAAWARRTGSAPDAIAWATDPTK